MGKTISLDFVYIHTSVCIYDKVWLIDSSANKQSKQQQKKESKQRINKKMYAEKDYLHMLRIIKSLFLDQ